MAGGSTHAFDQRHVLYSKLRPNLNKVVLPDEPGIATTELVPLLPDPSRCDRGYLAHYLRSPRFVDWATARTAGAKMPRLNMKEFRAHKIPLPPLPEQRRIAAILDKADALRAKRREAIAKCDQLLQSVFLDMFGDPVTNPRGWRTSALAEISDAKDRINYGVVQPGEDLANGVPLVRVGDIDGGVLDTSQIKHISPDIESRYSRSRLKGNELLVSCVGSIGLVADVPEWAAGHNIARAITRVPLAVPAMRPFVRECLRTPGVQRYFSEKTRTVSQPTLNVQFVKEAPIILPPVEEISRFKSVADQVKKQRSLIGRSELGLDASFDSLQHLAFAGRLFTA